MKRTALRSLIAASLTLASLSATAATNPSAATPNSSQGDITITLSLVPHVIITGLDDMNINATGSEDITQTDNICIGGSGFSSFTVSFASQNGNASLGSPSATDPFLLVDSGTSESIPYSVAFANSAGAATADETSIDGTLSTTFTRQSGATAAHCLGGGENATLFVNIAAADWQGVDGSAFTDTLTVMVEAI